MMFVPHRKQVSTACYGDSFIVSFIKVIRNNSNDNDNTEAEE
jgi:hypothetical protein